MKYLGIALVGSLALVSFGGPARAEAPRLTLFEEAGRLVDQMAEHLRGLAAQVEPYRHHQQQGGGPGGGRFGPGRGDPAASPAERPLITIMLHHRAELGLTPEQVGRLEALRGEFTREAIRRDAEIRIAELDVATLLAQDPVDLASAEAKIREVAQLRAELRVARLRTIEQGKGVLTPEQKTRLQGVLGGGMPGPRRSAAATAL